MKNAAITIALNLLAEGKPIQATDLLYDFGHTDGAIAGVESFVGLLLNNAKRPLSSDAADIVRDTYTEWRCTISSKSGT